MKILIIDDEVVSRRLLQKTVQELGHEVLTAENGEQGWEILQRDEIRFVIADWLMPVMDGVSLCRRIRATGNAKYVYFILVTGKDKKQDLVEGLSSGADDYVAKPFDRAELEVRVRAGERILTLEKNLREKNERLNELNEILEKISRIDPLTKVGNRRRFYESIKKAHHRATRYDHTYGIVMCDIDDFKAYNDSYGHLEGDRILSLVANSIEKSLRYSDEVFRFGGEEFVILLHGQELEGVRMFADRVRESIASQKIEHKGGREGIVTVSCGVEAITKDNRDKEWEDLLNNADKALYAAKSAGKNRVCAPGDVA